MTPSDGQVFSRNAFFLDYSFLVVFLLLFFFFLPMVKCFFLFFEECAAKRK